MSSIERLASQCGLSTGEKRGRWTCYFPCSRYWWGAEGWRWKYSKRFHLWFHPNDNLLPRMWCFIWPREAEWCRASFKQHVLQTQKRVIEMHCAWFEAHALFLCSCCLQQEYHHHLVVIFDLSFFFYITADWNVSSQESKWIKSINRFSCFLSAPEFKMKAMKWVSFMF